MNLEENKLLKLGIMGGTFDPIHLGHLKVAEVAHSRFQLEKVIFVTSHCPPHKSIEQITPVEHRYAMVELAIKDIPHFASSRIEMERSCPSYAGDTIKAFKEHYGKEWLLYFITGVDVLPTIINWDKARTYPGLCYFIAAARPGYNRQEAERKLPAEVIPYITILEEPSLSISSTEIRHRVKTHQPIDALVPETVQEYIFKWGLYQAP